MFNYWLTQSWLLFRFYRLRVLLSLLSIAVGIGAVCALCAINSIVAKNSEDVLTKYGQSRFTATIAPVSSLGKKQAALYLHPSLVANFSQSLQEQMTLIPCQVVHFDHDQVIVGTLNGIERHLQWPMISGRGLHRLDENAKVVVVGRAVGLKVGDTISLYGNYFTVIGVLGELEPNPLFEFSPNHALFISIGMLARLKPIPWVDSFIVQSQSLSLEQAQAAFQAKVKAWHIDGLFIRDASIFQLALLKQVKTTIQMLKLIALATLFLGMLSMLNLLVILIDERKKEIGLRIALGATLANIGWQFLFEIMMLCSLGAVVGIVFGQLAAYIIVMKLGLTYYFSGFSWLVGVVTSLLMGSLSGIMPAIFAAKWHPVKLLNS
ncbi:MAG: ABC transporter permease [Candidatus Berkiella sp.]